MNPKTTARLRITLDVDYPAWLVGNLGRATERHLAEAMRAVPGAQLRVDDRVLHISGVAGLTHVLQALHAAAVATEAEAREGSPSVASFTGPLLRGSAVLDAAEEGEAA